MKVTKFVNLVAVGLALTCAVGCKKKPVGVTELPGHKPAVIGDTDQGNMLQNPPGTGDTGTTPMGNPADWANATRNETKFAADTVHFKYDSSVVPSSDKSKIAEVADYLKGTPNTGVEVDGHCDERGTDEYNRALGERRALAVREELIAQGVDGARVMTVSFGRSRPADTGHSDASHAKNRRAEFVLLTK
jgi:peptidoglycan-associated lipoprotein